METTRRHCKNCAKDFDGVREPHVSVDLYGKVNPALSNSHVRKVGREYYCKDCWLSKSFRPKASL